MCEVIVKEIDEKYPDTDWNQDKACEEWLKRVVELKDNNIDFNLGAFAKLGCTCPSCGDIICAWCA